jgi:hypothetical protein
MPAAVDQAAISQASWIRPSRRLSRRLTSFWSGGRERTTERCFGRRGIDLTSRAMTGGCVRAFVVSASSTMVLHTLRRAVVVVQDCRQTIEEGMV